MIKAGKENAHTYPIGWNISLPAQLLTVLPAYHFYSDILTCSPFCYKVRRKNIAVLQKEFFRISIIKNVMIMEFAGELPYTKKITRKSSPSSFVFKRKNRNLAKNGNGLRFLSV